MTDPSDVFPCHPQLRGGTTILAGNSSPLCCISHPHFQLRCAYCSKTGRNTTGPHQIFCIYHKACGSSDVAIMGAGKCRFLDVVIGCFTIQPKGLCVSFMVFTKTGLFESPFMFPIMLSFHAQLCSPSRPGCSYSCLWLLS